MASRGGQRLPPAPASARRHRWSPYRQSGDSGRVAVEARWSASPGCDSLDPATAMPAYQPSPWLRVCRCDESRWSAAPTRASLDPASAVVGVLAVPEAPAVMPCRVRVISGSRPRQSRQATAMLSVRPTARSGLDPATFMVSVSAIPMARAVPPWRVPDSGPRGRLPRSAPV
jgi:hypothetical protein